MAKKEELMTLEEIHDFGIQIVKDTLVHDGYTINQINNELGMSPQIVAQKDDVLAFVAVRTACFPHKGELDSSDHFMMIDHAKKYKAIPYFASIGIANANATTDIERSIPLKGSPFHASYEGLLIIATSDNVKIADEKGIRYLTEDDLRK